MCPSHVIVLYSHTRNGEIQYSDHHQPVVRRADIERFKTKNLEV